MAHKIRLVKEYRDVGTDAKKPFRRLRSVTVIHTGRGGRRILGVESALKRAKQIAQDERRELIEAHAYDHPNDRHFFKKHGLPMVSAV